MQMQFVSFASMIDAFQCVNNDDFKKLIFCAYSVLAWYWHKLAPGQKMLVSSYWRVKLSVILYVIRINTHTSKRTENLYMTCHFMRKMSRKKQTLHLTSHFRPRHMLVHTINSFVLLYILLVSNVNAGFMLLRSDLNWHSGGGTVIWSGGTIRCKDHKTENTSQTCYVSIFTVS